MLHFRFYIFQENQRIKWTALSVERMNYEKYIEAMKKALPALESA